MAMQTVNWSESEINDFVSQAVKSYRLVCVSARANNNKYWFADVAPDGRVLRRYARIGYTQKPKMEVFGSSSAAIRKIERDAQKKRNYSGDKEPYTDIDLSETQTNAIVAGASLESLAKDQIAKGNPELAKLVEFFVRRNIHEITSKTQITYSNGQLRTAVGVITQHTITLARLKLDEIATSIAKGYNRNDNWRFVRQVEDFLKMVPEKIKGKVNPEELFRNRQSVTDRLDLLDAMGSLIVDDDSTKQDEQVFDMTLEKVTDRNIIDRIKRKFLSTVNRRHHRDVANMRLKNVWAVDIAGDEYDDSNGNVMGLWHGTKASNILAIWKKGLQIIKSGPHTTGKMFGDGIYFSDQSTKALNYAKTFWGGRDEGRYFMFLVDVSMGKAYTPRSSKHSGWTPPRGYNSTFAKGGQSGVSNNEMIVYNESHCKIRYLCEFVD